VSAQAWVGRKPGCNCPTFAALDVKHRRAPVVRMGRIVGKRWRDTEGELSMTRVPVEQANVAICRCQG